MVFDSTATTPVSSMSSDRSKFGIVSSVGLVCGKDIQTSKAREISIAGSSSAAFGANPPYNLFVRGIPSLIMEL